VRHFFSDFYYLYTVDSVFFHCLLLCSLLSSTNPFIKQSFINYLTSYPLRFFTYCLLLFFCFFFHPCHFLFCCFNSSSVLRLLKDEEKIGLEDSISMSQVKDDFRTLQVRDLSQVGVPDVEILVTSLSAGECYVEESAALWRSILSRINDDDKSGSGSAGSDKMRHIQSQKIIDNLKTALECVRNIIGGFMNEPLNDDVLVSKSSRFVMQYLAVIEMIRHSPGGPQQNDLFHSTFQAEMAAICEDFLMTVLENRNLLCHRDDESQTSRGKICRAVLNSSHFLRLFCQFLRSMTQSFSLPHTVRNHHSMIWILVVMLEQDRIKDDCVLNLEVASLLFQFVELWKSTDYVPAESDYKFKKFNGNEAQEMLSSALKYAVTAAKGVKMFMGISVSDGASDVSAHARKEHSLGISTATAPSLYQSATQLIYKLQCIRSVFNGEGLEPSVPCGSTDSDGRIFEIMPVIQNTTTPPVDEVERTYKQYLRGLHWMPSVESFKHTQRSD
jgi:hypothetical protein